MVKNGMKKGSTSVDLDKLKSLMRMKPTLEDTAAFFDCSTRTIERLIKDNFGLNFVNFRQQNMVHTRHDLVRNAIQMAMSGNTAMMIFCLKNLCGWADKLDVGNEGGKAFQLSYSTKANKEEKEDQSEES